MTTDTRLSFRHILMGSILALSHPLFGAGEPVFSTRPIVSNVVADNPDVPATVYCGKTLVIPLAVTDPERDALSYTVTTSHPWLLARVRTGHPVMKMRVRSANDGLGAPIDGMMEFALFRADTPDTADFIAGFAQAPYYENVLFHRVIDNFVLQGGDPAGTGSGNSPYVMPHEFNSHLIYSGRGQLAMANSAGGYTQTYAGYGRSFTIQGGTIEYRTANTVATNGSQFFITLGQPRHLDFRHSLFGQIIRGFDVMDKVSNVPVGANDKPTVNVTMSELSVNPSSSDGVLLVSATSVGTGTVTVTAKDPSGNSSQRIYTLNAAKDAVNDPPILAPLAPQVLPVGQVPNVTTHAEDLEHDGISIRMPLQVNRSFFNGSPNSSSNIYAGFNSGNLGVVSRPTAGAWDITVGVTGVNDSLINSQPPNGAVFQLLEVGVGDQAIEVTPVTLEAKAGVSTGSVTLASFRYGGTLSAPGDFIASVIWGDGTARQASNGASPAITIVPSSSRPGMWDVKGTHTFVRAGVYPLHVTLDGPLGATRLARGSTVVSADGALFSAIGQDHKLAGATFATNPIAVIADATVGVKASDFSTTIDWGDGNRSTTGATVRQIGAGRFGVYATHRYSDAEVYSVMVTVRRAAFSASAWSKLDATGFTSPRYLPPFAKANLSSSWSQAINVGGTQVSGLPQKVVKGSQASITGYFSVVNTGSKAAVSPKLRFYLSNDAALVKTGNGADTLLKIGPSTSSMTQIPLRSLRPGEGGAIPIRAANGVDLTLRLPANETGAGKYLITDVDYSDPITDNMAIAKQVVFGPFSGIVVKLPPNTPSGGLVVTEAAPVGADFPAQAKATFTVALDTLPTANVVIPLEVLNSSSVVDNSQVTLSASELVFTPQNGTIAQTVTITAKNNDAREESVQQVVRLKPATSTDARFNNTDAPDIPVTILDEDAKVGIVVSRTSIALTEGANVSFTLTPSVATRQDALMEMDVVDSNGAVVTGQVTIAPSTVTFTASGGVTPKTVVITAVNDTVAEALANYTLRLKAITSNDLTYKDVDLADLPLTITDND